MARIAKTEGTVLRISPYSETSLVIAWLTRDAGKVSTMCKGALRPRSLFLGQFDLFYTCELLYYDHDRHGLRILKECTPLRPRNALRTDWRACAGASYLADLVFRVSPSRAHHPGVFEWLDVALDDLAGEGAQAVTLFWQELRLLSLLGLKPRLTRCAVCGRALPAQERGTVFDPAHGGSVCANCSRDGHISGTELTADVRATLAAWQRARTPRTARRTRINSAQEHCVEDLLLRFLQYHLETPLRSRAIALDIMRRSPGEVVPG